MNLKKGQSVLILVFILFLLSISTAEAATKTGPAIINRDPSDPSINEGIAQIQAGVKTDVDPLLGILPASYDWFAGMSRAIGSLVQPFKADPTYLGMKTGQSQFAERVKQSVVRLFSDYKKIGGKNITDTPKLGTVCGDNPGDPYWVGYPREVSLGNIEIGPPFQDWHHQYDCFCRCGEKVECPIPDFAGQVNVHRNAGGKATWNIPCETCFGSRIVKHDKYIGTDHGTFPGYPKGAPTDSGYQECLRQSAESYAASGPGGSPTDTDIFGI
jgi:hypothetical protein